MYCTVSGHLPEKMTSYCFPEKVLCFRVRVEVRIRVSGNTFSVKRPFRRCTRSILYSYLILDLFSGGIYASYSVLPSIPEVIYTTAVQIHARPFRTG